MNASDTYVLGRSDRETRRLILQHQIYAPLTRRFFEAAGIGPGMRVLDVGSGAGDVALLLAELVGPRGRVMGVEMNAAILDTARARAEALGLKNVTFHAGEAGAIESGRDFDAVAGRWILMHVPHPADLLRDLAAMLRPGGIVAFHENDFTYPPTSFPPTRAAEEVQRVAVPPPGLAGPNMRTGTALYAMYLEAGLPAPELMLEAPIGGGEDWPGYEYTAETIRSLLPALEQATGLDPAQVRIDTLASRLRDEIVALRGVQMLPMMIGAWTRTR